METKKRYRINCFIIILCALIFFGCINVLSKMVFHKSISRFFMEFVWGAGKPDDFEEKWSQIENRKAIDDINTSFFTSDVRLEEYKGMKVYCG